MTLHDHILSRAHLEKTLVDAGFVEVRSWQIKVYMGDWGEGTPFIDETEWTPILTVLAATAWARA